QDCQPIARDRGPHAHQGLHHRLQDHLVVGFVFANQDKRVGAYHRASPFEDAASTRLRVLSNPRISCRTSSSGTACLWITRSVPPSGGRGSSPVTSFAVITITGKPRVRGCSRGVCKTWKPSPRGIIRSSPMAVGGSLATAASAASPSAAVATRQPSSASKLLST